MTRQTDVHDSEHSFVRGFVLTPVAMFAPLLLAMAGIAIRWADVQERSFEALFYWSSLLMPYWTQPPVVPSALGAILGAAHWLVVGTAFAVVSRRLRFGWALALAVASVIATGGIAVLILWQLGFEHRFEGL